MREGQRSASQGTRPDGIVKIRCVTDGSRLWHIAPRNRTWFDGSLQRDGPLIELLFAYGAGLLTLINPCVLPVLPIILASALSADRRGPLALAAGMSLSFVVFGMTVAAVGHSIGLTETALSNIAATLMVFFGLVLVVPAFSRQFETATAGFAAGADSRMHGMDLSGLRGQFLGGTLLRAVWSSCILTLGYGAGRALRSDGLRTFAQRSKPLSGILFIAVGAMILLRIHHVIEAWAVQALPLWLQDLSVAL